MSNEGKSSTDMFVGTLIDNIRKEAVLEYIERLKEKLSHRALFSVTSTIDEVAKEMGFVKSE